MKSKPTFRLVPMFNPASAALRTMVDGILEAPAPAAFQVIAVDLPGLRPVLDETRHEADGWLMFAGTRQVAQTFARLQRRLPIVNLSAGLADNPLPSVWPDNEEIGRLAGEHLLATGLSRFAYLGDPAAEHYSVLRLEGFRRVLAGRSCAVLDGVASSVASAAAWRDLRRALVRRKASGGAEGSGGG